MVAEIEFDSSSGKLFGEIPQVPTVPGYYGVWEPYTLKGATHDVIINAVYSKSADQQVLTVTDVNKLFEYMSKGKEISMSQDLDGSYSSAADKIFSEVVSKPEVTGDYESRLDLDSFTLHFTGKANGNQDWTMFKVLKGSKLIIGTGITGSGLLRFDFTQLHSSSTPTIFHLEDAGDDKAGGTLVLERGVVIEMQLPSGASNDIKPFIGVNYEDQTKYPGLHVDKSTVGFVRITVTARTVLVGDGSN